MSRKKGNIKFKWQFFLITFIILIAVIRIVDGYWGKKKPEGNSKKESVKESLSNFKKDSLDPDTYKLIVYGKDLIANTSKYYGPKGSLGKKANTLNCQNCHLDAGSKPWGNNYLAVYSTYPKYRDRSGSIETIPKRVNDCFERSLNGKALDSGSSEMLAIVAYIEWLGKDVAKGSKPIGSGIRELAFPDRPSNPALGQIIYAGQCKSCHGRNGEGTKTSDGIFVYPPLWGDGSYNVGAGLYRISKLAGYVKDNMPFNLSSHDKPVLTDQQAWDVAAYINSRPRPKKDLSRDWPDISKKPIDHPFGPYTDGFSEKQHKYGPFPPIIAARKKQAL